MYPRACQNGLIVEEVSNGLVLRDQRRNKVHCLNPVLSWLWRRCDGRTPVSLLVERIRWEFRITDPQPAVEGLLEKLAQRGLVEEGDEDLCPPRRTTSLARLVGIVLGIPALFKAFAWI
jgi:hypothetical protein